MCGLDGGDSDLDQSEKMRYCRRLVQYCDSHRSRLTPRGDLPAVPMSARWANPPLRALNTFPIQIFKQPINFRHTFATLRRDAPELCMNPSPKEGVGTAGCPLHPQPRVRFALVKSTRVNEYTGITRRSRTQWF